jgi:hypothetical protein
MEWLADVIERLAVGRWLECGKMADVPNWKMTERNGWMEFKNWRMCQTVVR